MKAHAKLYVSSPMVPGVFGDGKWLLLVALKDHGSISKAAQSLGRSYRKAWGDIKRAEQALGRPLVSKTRGGVAGGRSELTEYCVRLLGAWEKHRALVHRTLASSYDLNLRPLLEGASPRRPRRQAGKQR